jgi:hypothetical protein
MYLKSVLSHIYFIKCAGGKSACIYHLNDVDPPRLPPTWTLVVKIQWNFEEEMKIMNQCGEKTQALESRK